MTEPTPEVKLLHKILDAWNDLAEGDYLPQEVEDWLRDKMAPAMASTRILLKRKL